MHRFFFFATLLLAIPAQAQVAINWVTVGTPGNNADTEVMATDGTTGYGRVNFLYRIGRYEVTNTEYAAFLNSVAAADPNGLYNTRMGSPPLPFEIMGGITRSGVSGSYVYSVIAGRENRPVNYVSFYDALRFANWLQNGQPTGAQDNTTTEGGAYTLTPQGIEWNTIVRNPGATVFLPSENQWYKAAYYRQGGISATYFDTATRSNGFFVPSPQTDPPTPAVYTGTECFVPAVPAQENRANCGSVVGDLLDVGSYPASESPWFTYDQGGNVWEWNEAIIGFDGKPNSFRVNFAVGAGSVSGFIQTDGKNGVLAQSNIIDWKLTIWDGTNSVPVSLTGPKSGSNSLLTVTGTSLTVVATGSQQPQLFFDFSNAAGNRVRFVNKNPDHDTEQLCVEGTTNGCGGAEFASSVNLTLDGSNIQSTGALAGVQPLSIPDDWSRGVRGGSYSSLQLLVGTGSSTRGSGSPAEEGGGLGFRVASTAPAAAAAPPPQPIPAVGAVGLLLVAAGLLGFEGYLRTRA